MLFRGDPETPAMVRFRKLYRIGQGEAHLALKRPPVDRTPRSLNGSYREGFFDRLFGIGNRPR